MADQVEKPTRFTAALKVGSPVGYFGGGIIGVVGGAGLIAAALIAPGYTAGAQIVVGAILVIVFGVFLLKLPRWLKARRLAVVVFSPEGAIDVRALGRPLAWSSITRIYDRPTQHGLMLVLDGTPEAFAAANPKRRWWRTMRSVEYGVSRNALVIRPIGLTAKPSELREAAEAFWAAYRDDHSGAGGPWS